MRLEAQGPIRVILADDHQLVRSGIARLLSRVQHVVLLGEAANGRELVTMVDTLRPDIVLTDIDMPEMDGIEATEKIRQRHPGVKVIVLTMLDEVDYVKRAVAKGACGYLLKDAPALELELAVTWAMQKGSYFSPAIAERLLTAEPSAKEQLTDRQLEILHLLVEGQSTKEIAHRLGLSIKTVDVHRGEIMKRVGVNDVASLTRYALRKGLIKP